MSSAAPPLGELAARPSVRILLLRGHMSDAEGKRHGPGDIVTMPGVQAVGFLMNGVADLAPDEIAPEVEGIKVE